MQRVSSMRIPQHLLPGLTAFLSISLLSPAYADKQACWEPHTSTPQDGVLCWFDDSSSGLGWQVGSTTSVTVGKKKGMACSKVQDKSVDFPHSESKFLWLRVEDMSQLSSDNIKFFKPRYEFISQIPYCAGTQPESKGKFPAIPDSRQQSLEDDDYICRILSGNKVLIGLAIDGDACQDLLDVSYDSFSLKDSGPTPRKHQWERLHIHDHCGWPMRLNDQGQWVKSHFRCSGGKNKKASKAQAEAERHDHRYAAVDDGDACWTGQRIDRDDCKDWNRVYQDLSVPEWED